MTFYAKLLQIAAQHAVQQFHHKTTVYSTYAYVAATRCCQTTSRTKWNLDPNKRQLRRTRPRGCYLFFLLMYTYILRSTWRPHSVSIMTHRTFQPLSRWGTIDRYLKCDDLEYDFGEHGTVMWSWHLYSELQALATATAVKNFQCTKSTEK